MKTMPNNDQDYKHETDRLIDFRMVTDIENISSSGQPGAPSGDGGPTGYFDCAQEIQNKEADRSETGEADITQRDEVYGGAGRFKVGQLKFLGQQRQGASRESNVVDRKPAEAQEYAVQNAENSLYATDAPAILQQTVLITSQSDFAPTNLNVFIDSIETRQLDNQRNQARNKNEKAVNDYGPQHQNGEEQYRSYKELPRDLKQPSCFQIPDVIIEQDNSKPQTNYNTESKPLRPSQPPMQSNPASLLSKSEKRLHRPADWHPDNSFGEAYQQLEQSANIHDLSAFHQDAQKDQRYQIQVFEPSAHRVSIYHSQEFENALPRTGQPYQSQAPGDWASGRADGIGECFGEGFGAQNAIDIGLQRNSAGHNGNSIAQKLVHENKMLQSKIQVQGIQESLYHRELGNLKEEVRRGREERERMKAEWEQDRAVLEAGAAEKDRELGQVRKWNEQLRASAAQQTTKLNEFNKQLQALKCSHALLGQETKSMLEGKLASLSSDVESEFADRIIGLSTKLANSQQRLKSTGAKLQADPEPELVVNQLKAELAEKDQQIANLSADHRGLAERHEALAAQNQAHLEQLESYRKDLLAVEILKTEVQVKMGELEEEQAQNEKIIYEKMKQNEVLKEQVLLFEQTVEELHFQVWNLDQQKGGKDNKTKQKEERQSEGKSEYDQSEAYDATARKLPDLSRGSDTNSDPRPAQDQTSPPRRDGLDQQRLRNQQTFPARERVEPAPSGDGRAAADDAQQAQNRLDKTFKTITEAVGEEDEEIMAGRVQSRGEAFPGREEDLATNGPSYQQDMDNSKEGPPPSRGSSQRQYQQDLEDLRAKFENIVKNSAHVDEINDDIQRIQGEWQNNEHDSSMALGYYQQLEKGQDPDSFQRNRSTAEYVPDFVQAKATNRSYESGKALEQIAISRTITADSYHRTAPDQSQNNSEQLDQNRQKALQATKLTVGNQILQLKDLLDLGESDKDKTYFQENSSEIGEPQAKNEGNRQHSASLHVTAGLKQRSPLLMKEPGSRESKKSQKLNTQGTLQHFRAGENTGDQSATVQEFSVSSQNQLNLSENQRQSPTGDLDGTTGKIQKDKGNQLAKAGDRVKGKQRSDEGSWNDVDSNESPGLCFMSKMPGPGDRGQVVKRKNWFSTAAQRPTASDQPSNDSNKSIQATSIKVPLESLPHEEGHEKASEIRSRSREEGLSQPQMEEDTPIKQSFSVAQRAEELKQSPYDPSIAENPHGSPRREPTFRRQIKDGNQLSPLLQLDPSEQFRPAERLARSPRSSMVEGSEMMSESHLLTITERTNEDSMQSDVSQISFSQMLVNDLKQMIQRRDAQNKPNAQPQSWAQKTQNQAAQCAPRDPFAQGKPSQITGIDVRKTAASRGQGGPGTRIPRDLIETHKPELPKPKPNDLRVNAGAPRIEDFCTDFDVDDETDEKTQSDENQQVLSNQPTPSASEHSGRGPQQRRKMLKQGGYFASNPCDVDSSATDPMVSPMITPMQLMSIASQSNSGSSGRVSARQNQNQQLTPNLSTSQSHLTASRVLNQSSHHHWQDRGSQQDEGSHPSLSRQGSRRTIKNSRQNGSRPVQNHMIQKDEKNSSALDRSGQELDADYSGYVNMGGQDGDVSYSDDGTRDRNEPPSSIQSSKRGSAGRHNIQN